MGIAGRKRVETNYRVEDEATRIIEFFRTLQWKRFKGSVKNRECLRFLNGTAIVCQ